MEEFTGNPPYSISPYSAVRQATVVRRPITHTFEVFVTAIGVWWPVQPFSAGGERVVDVTMEPRLNGRVYETWADGTVGDGAACWPSIPRTGSR
jgi:hypothetical protein